MRAKMIDVVYKVARQHHVRFYDQNLPFQLSFSSKTFISVVDYFRPPFNGGVRPMERKTAELLRVNVNRVMHETYCQMKEAFAPLPSFKKRLSEHCKSTSWKRGSSMMPLNKTIKRRNA